MQIGLILHDAQSGLARINLLNNAGATVHLPDVAPGTTEPVTVLVNLVQPEGVLVEIAVVDTAGNDRTTCRLSGEIVNAALSVDYTTSYNDRTRTFTLVPTWSHTGGDDILAPVGIRVVQIDGPGCPCTMSDHLGQQGGLESSFPVALTADLANGLLTPGESFDHTLHVHLAQRASFSVYVDIWGVRFTNEAVVDGTALRSYPTPRDSFAFHISEDDLTDTTSRMLYLPLITRSR